jgi:hypothetical protein
MGLNAAAANLTATVAAAKQAGPPRKRRAKEPPAPEELRRSARPRTEVRRRLLAGVRAVAAPPTSSWTACTVGTGCNPVPGAHVSHVAEGTANSAAAAAAAATAQRAL